MTNPSLSAVALAAWFAVVPASALAQAAPAASAAARQVVTQADQLPRRTLLLSHLPSEYLDMPIEALKGLAAEIEANTIADLSNYEIRDTATLRKMYGNLARRAGLRGDWAAVPGWTAKARALEEKPGARLTSGVMTDLMAQQQFEKHDAAWLEAAIKNRFGALPWADVGENIKAAKGGTETFSPELTRGALQAQLDPQAKNGQMKVPEEAAMFIVGARMQTELMTPNKASVVSALKAVIAANESRVPKPDIWTPRTFSLPADAAGKKVVVGIWDSGVDLSLFTAASGRGVAFDEDYRPTKALLYPLGAAEVAWPKLRGLLKGTMDQRAALDTPDAQGLRDVMAQLKAGQVKDFIETLGLAGLHAHGTHVAGIVTDGNPFAEVYAGTMYLSPKVDPVAPTEARERAGAAMFTAMVQSFKDAGARVVNMSWGTSPAEIESALAFHNLGGSAEGRKQEAQRLFAFQHEALREAIAAAPGILFVAASGNSNNSADFENVIPSGLELPNLITVGAVDRAGNETSFSTFGKTVVVHANGLDVEGPVPGGVRLKLSGTSMSSPQVANLAAKLIALKPELTPIELKRLILSGADRLPGADGRPGRVVLANPRRSAELAGIRL
jgi:subtilisin family serine protease